MVEKNQQQQNETASYAERRERTGERPEQSRDFTTYEKVKDVALEARESARDGYHAYQEGAGLSGAVAAAKDSFTERFEKKSPPGEAPPVASGRELYDEVKGSMGFGRSDDSGRWSGAERERDLSPGASRLRERDADVRPAAFKSADLQASAAAKDLADREYARSGDYAARSDLGESAKETARYARDRASDYAESAKDKARDYAESAKDTARDYAESAKDKARYARDRAGDYAESAKDTARDYARSARDTAADYTESAKDSVRRTARDVADSARDKASEYAESAKDTARYARDRAGDYAESAKESVKETARDARDKASEYAESAKDTARDAAYAARDTAAAAVSPSGVDVALTPTSERVATALETSILGQDETLDSFSVKQFVQVERERARSGL